MQQATEKFNIEVGQTSTKQNQAPGKEQKQFSGRSYVLPYFLEYVVNIETNTLLLIFQRLWQKLPYIFFSKII